MSPKPKKAEAKAEKKSAAPAKSAKASKSDGKVEAKSAAAGDEAVPQVDPDELEEQEDAAAAASSGGAGNAAALAAAAATGGTEMSASFKNFRHHPDMENFYRFIYENDLRHEALAIIDTMMGEKAQRKLVKGAKASAH